MDRRRARIAGVIVCVIAAAAGTYLVGNDAVALWDRDEPRYAQASRQMLQSGDWVVVRFLDELRARKPPLIYWVQAGSMMALGESVFAARLPSTVAMVAAAAMLAAAVWRAAGPTRAMWTTIVFSTSLMVIFTAKVTLTDAVLLLWVATGQLCLYRLYRLPRGGGGGGLAAALFWTAAGLGAMTKGTNLAIHAVTLLALAALDVGRDPRGWRSIRAWLASAAWWRRLRPLVGLLIFLAVTLPWHLLVHQREPRFLAMLFGNIGKHAAGSAEGHGMPPGYYLLTIWPFFLPWSVLLPMALYWGWKRRRLPTHRFALAMILGPWLFFELVWSKLPHYLLPIYPALAFLTADAIVRCLRGALDDLIRPAFSRAMAGWSLIVIGVGAAPWILLHWFPKAAPVWAMTTVTATAVLYAASVYLLFRAHAIRWGLMSMGGGMLALCIAVFGVYFPRARFLHTSQRTADILIANGVTGPGQVVMLDYKEPSLAFYQGGTIREHSNTVITTRFLEQAPQWLVVTRTVWIDPRTQQAARDALEQVGPTITGLDIADGLRPVEVMVLRKREPSAPPPGNP